MVRRARYLRMHAQTLRVVARLVLVECEPQPSYELTAEGEKGSARKFNRPLDPGHVLQSTVQQYYQRVTGMGNGKNERDRPFARCGIAMRMIWRYSETVVQSL